MTKETVNNEDDVNDPWSVHLNQWRARLKMSASLLCQVSLKLQEAVNDERRFALLTDLTTFDDQAIGAEHQEFKRLLEEALTALIDLTAYNNPDREYPDLKMGFGFECANVTFGKIIDIFRIPPQP